MEAKKRITEAPMPEMHLKRQKPEIPHKNMEETTIDDKDVNEIVINGLVSDFIELTLSSANRPPKFIIALNEIKEIIKRLVKK